MRDKDAWAAYNATVIQTNWRRIAAASELVRRRARLEERCEIIDQLRPLYIEMYSLPDKVVRPSGHKLLDKLIIQVNPPPPTTTLPLTPFRSPVLDLSPMDELAPFTASESGRALLDVVAGADGNGGIEWTREMGGEGREYFSTRPCDTATPDAKCRLCLRGHCLEVEWAHGRGGGHDEHAESSTCAACPQDVCKDMPDILGEKAVRALRNKIASLHKEKEIRIATLDKTHHTLSIHWRLMELPEERWLELPPAGEPLPHPGACLMGGAFPLQTRQLLGGIILVMASQRTQRGKAGIECGNSRVAAASVLLKSRDTGGGVRGWAPLLGRSG